MTGLIIGRTGQLSRCLQQLRVDADYLDRQALDLGDPDHVYDKIVALKPEYIVNTAAYTAVDKAEIEEALANTVNGTAVGRIAAAASNLDAPLIHVSTDYVFSGNAPGAYEEEDPTDPINAYGRSKLLGEQLINTQALKSFWILRTSWVYSEFDGNFVKTVLRLSEDGSQPLRIVGDQTGCPTYAGDIAKAIVLVLECWRKGAPIPSGTYHCTSSKAASWAEFAQVIVRKAVEQGLRTAAPEVEAISTAEYPTPAKRPANSTLNSTKLTRALDWKLPDWRDSLTGVLARLKLEA